MRAGGTCTPTHRVVLLYIFQVAVGDDTTLVPTGYAGCVSPTLNYLVLPDHRAHLYAQLGSSYRRYEASNCRPCTDAQTWEENRMTRVCVGFLPDGDTL